MNNSELSQAFKKANSIAKYQFGTTSRKMKDVLNVLTDYIENNNGIDHDTLVGINNSVWVQEEVVALCRDGLDADGIRFGGGRFTAFEATGESHVAFEDGTTVPVKPYFYEMELFTPNRAFVQLKMSKHTAGDCTTEAMFIGSMPVCQISPKSVTLDKTKQKITCRYAYPDEAYCGYGIITDKLDRTKPHDPAYFEGSDLSREKEPFITATIVNPNLITVYDNVNDKIIRFVRKSENEICYLRIANTYIDFVNYTGKTIYRAPRNIKVC